MCGRAKDFQVSILVFRGNFFLKFHSISRFLFVKFCFELPFGFVVCRLNFYFFFQVYIVCVLVGATKALILKIGD